MLLADVAATSLAVAATASRTAKTALLAERLRAAAPDEVPVVAAYLAGELRQRRTGVGVASLRDLPGPAAAPSLQVLEVDATLEQVAAVSGTGAQAARRALLVGLWARATAAEQRLLLGLLSGDLRQGALDALVVDAVARAAGLPVADVRRAVMLRGALGPVAVAALGSGATGLAAFRLEVGRPVRPMLASPAATLDDALPGAGTPDEDPDAPLDVAVDVKVDGIRVQVHRAGDDVAVFTRTLDDVTDRLPEVVEAALRLPARALVLDGEAVALRPDGRPEPFQVTAARTGSRVDVAAARARTPVTPLLFDVLHTDGEDLLATPLCERAAVLGRLVPGGERVDRLVTPDRAQAAAFAAAALAAGHEGVVVKDLASAYEAGRRGAAWRKVKPVHTVDLLVLGAEWGHGRRSGWLSNLHLGARDVAGGPPVMLGKTFKGLTDAMLAWQTERLLELEVGRRGITVLVRPLLVVEVAFDGLQDSPRYPGGVALRFARVVRHRPDKDPAEADTLDAVLATRPGA